MRTILAVMIILLASACGRQSPPGATNPPPEERNRLAVERDSDKDEVEADADVDPEQDEEANEKPAQGDLTIHPGLGFGAISGRTDRAQLELTYGEGRVSGKNFYVGEGYYEKGIAVFPGTPDEVEIMLDDQGAFNLVRVNREGSRWHTDEGIRIGSTLREVELANGGPFQFFGLDWDYGGTVADWQGGNFPEGFGIRLGWGERGANDPDGMPIGDDLFSSEDFPHLDLRVVAITQQF